MKLLNSGTAIAGLSEVKGQKYFFLVHNITNCNIFLYFSIEIKIHLRNKHFQRGNKLKREMTEKKTCVLSSQGYSFISSTTCIHSMI